MRYMLGIDVGGTFTDFVAYDSETRELDVWKHLSVPQDPVAGIKAGLERFAAPEAIRNVRLGTTVATNAILERKGAVIAYVDHQGLSRRAVHPARQPQVPLRHELGEAEAADEAPPLLRGERAGRPLRRGLTPLDEDAARAAAAARSASSARSRRSRSCCCSPTSTRRTSCA